MPKFWDAVNFSKGANPPREQWKAPPQLPAEQTEQAFGRFAKYVDHIKSLGVRFVTASELPAIYADRVRSEGLSESELLGLAKRWPTQKRAAWTTRCWPARPSRRPTSSNCWPWRRAH